jgi:hypothetical protein
MAFDFDIQNVLEDFNYLPDYRYKTFLSAYSCFGFDKGGVEVISQKYKVYLDEYNKLQF